MSHLSNNYSAGPGLKYVNKRCRCGQKAIVKISESTNNKNKLYYACTDGCSGWIGWCLLINEQYVSSLAICVIISRWSIWLCLTRIAWIAGWVKKIPTHVPTHCRLYRIAQEVDHCWTCSPLVHCTAIFIFP